MLDGRTTHVQTGSLGTPTHAAPELLREGRLCPAVDVYAFGIMGVFGLLGGGCSQATSCCNIMLHDATVVWFL